MLPSLPLPSREFRRTARHAAPSCLVWFFVQDSLPAFIAPAALYHRLLPRLLFAVCGLFQLVTGGRSHAGLVDAPRRPTRPSSSTCHRVNASMDLFHYVRTLRLRTCSCKLTPCVVSRHLHFICGGCWCRAVCTIIGCLWTFCGVLVWVLQRRDAALSLLVSRWDEHCLSYKRRGL